METSLLKTKLSIPPLRGPLVARDKLLDILQKCLDYSLTLISAPPGFGKTTLLSQCTHQDHADFSIAWLSLDTSDDDPVRYWHYVIGALQASTEIDTEEAELLLRTPAATADPNMESFITLLLNSLASVDKDCVIILDDYHLIESPAIHQSMIFLLEHLPPSIHVIIATREDPPFPLARFRGKGMLLTISSDELRFDLQDASRLLHLYQDYPLSEEDVTALNECVEGWAVGLKMAALSLKNNQEISRFIQSFTGSQSYIMDYLLEEVLQNQPEDTRRFLLTTSILDRLTGPLCDALTGDSDGNERLTSLERANLFIHPLDEERQWYRYEHLFADLLQHQLIAEYGSEHIQKLNQKASKWHEENNNLDIAVDHAIMAREWETSISLVNARYEELRKQGQFETLLKWFEIIPDEILRNYRHLYSLKANLLTSFNKSDAAEAALTYLTTEFNDDDDVQCEALFSLSNIARMRGDFTMGIALAKKVLSKLPFENVAMRARTNWMIGYQLYLSGHYCEAEPRLTEAYNLGLQAGESTAANAAMMILGVLAIYQGRLHHAISMINTLFKTSAQREKAYGDYTMSRAFYELNDLDQAADKARTSIEATNSGAWASKESNVSSYFLLARIHMIRGDEFRANQTLEDMDKASEHPTVSQSLRAAHAAFHTMFAIQRDDIEAATEWGNKLAQYGGDVLPLHFQYIPTRLLIAQGKKLEAAEFLKVLYDRLIQEGANGLAIGVRVCQSLAADNEASALEFLSDALANGETNGYIRTFVDEQRALKPLLQRLLEQGFLLNYVRRLLDVMDQEAIYRRVLNTGVSLLSLREFEILELLAADTATQDISERLSISLSTVKTHIHHILEKLESRDRIQAIYRAKELKII